MTKTLIAIGSVVIVLMLAMIIWSASNKDQTETGGSSPLSPERGVDADTRAVSKEPVVAKPKIVPKKMEPNKNQEDSIQALSAPVEDGVQRDIQQALQSMRESVENDDPRTPEMSQPYQRELPTEEELANPALYEAYELRQTKKVASMFSSVTKEIPMIKNRIEAAKMSGSQSDAEIQEAEEALAKMEELSQMLLMSDPELQKVLEDEIPEATATPNSE